MSEKNLFRHEFGLDILDSIFKISNKALTLRDLFDLCVKPSGKEK